MLPILFGLLITYGPSILCAVHIVRTGRPFFWLFIVMIFPGLGPLIYVIVEIVPGLLGGPTARKMGRAAREALDPEREYRQARQALEDAETVGNKMRLAQAASGLGRWAEAESLWAQCLVGPFKDDPVGILGHANTLLELGRYEDALARLEELHAIEKATETGPAALAFARAYEGVGRLQEAEGPYRFAADRVPGLEAAARYVAYLAKTGRKQDALIGFDEIERRFNKIARPLQRLERPWRDLAARAVGR
jgi:hypothetical protein